MVSTGYFRCSVFLTKNIIEVKFYEYMHIYKYICTYTHKNAHMQMYTHI